jgi:ABC-type Na+ efflux pump permease subunit
MTPSFNEDQAQQLRKRFEDSSENLETQEENVDVLSLPSRKEKYQKVKHKKKNNEEIISETKETRDKKKGRSFRFPLVRILLFLFLLLVVLVTTYPKWIEKLNL